MRSGRMAVSCTAGPSANPISGVSVQHQVASTGVLPLTGAFRSKGSGPPARVRCCNAITRLLQSGPEFHDKTEQLDFGATPPAVFLERSCTPALLYQVIGGE